MQSKHFIDFHLINSYQRSWTIRKPSHNIKCNTTHSVSLQDLASALWRTLRHCRFSMVTSNIPIMITTPLMGGEGQNVTVHFNVCKTSRLENWKKIKKDVPSHRSPIFLKGKTSKCNITFWRLTRVWRLVRSTCYLFSPPLQFSKILLKLGGGGGKAKKYCTVTFWRPPPNRVTKGVVIPLCIVFLLPILVVRMFPEPYNQRCTQIQVHSLGAYFVPGHLMVQ